MENPWRRLLALNPETEVWWDSSPLIWPNFKDDFPTSAPEKDREWLKKEFADMYLEAPVNRWLFDGCTTNPPLSWNVLKTRKAEWAGIIKEIRKAYTGKSKYGLFLKVYSEVVKRGAEALLPLFEASGGKKGHISGQVDPQLLRNSPAMIEMAEQLADLSPNVMIKIPGSTQGIPVFRHLASKGIATNATTVFTLPQIMMVAKMVHEGREIHLKDNPNPRFGWRAVCTEMSGRLEDSGSFRGVINAKNLDISPLELRFASEYIVKKAAALIEERNHPIKILKCSDRLHHNEKGEGFYPHIDALAGGPIIHTIPPKVVGEYMLLYKDKEITNGWNIPVQEKSLEKLRQVEFFRCASEETGYCVEEFNEIPSLLENEAEFVGAAREMIHYVGTFM